ncbi:MAG: hypothetical protein ABIM88_08450, partial [candidate division WOR-3 bacterium]
MILTGILSLSAEITMGFGQALPNERARSQTIYGEADWGYHTWTSLFIQASYVKGAWFGTEPYLRLGYMDHPAYIRMLYYNGYEIGNAELNESVVSYELGFSKPFGVRPRFRLYYGAALTGNFSRWERVIYKYPSELSRVNQVSPGLVGFARAEWWWKYRPYKSLDEEDLINCIIGLSARFSYMG